MRFDPNNHHRRSIRLPTFDYSAPNAYFVTICAYQREYLFGEIRNGIVGLNEIGLLVEYWWNEIPHHFPNVTLDPEYVIMPNHFHGIIWINPVGADRCVRPIKQTHQRIPEGAHVGAPLPKIMQWFKMITTNIYFQNRKRNSIEFGGKLWHRNYYERIIRSESELYAVRSYIRNNPQNWAIDPERNTIDPRANTRYANSICSPNSSASS
jgi:putative transposase